MYNRCMARKRTLKASDLKGIFLYQDPKLGTIFWDVCTQKGYQLINQDCSKFQIYSGIFPLSFIIAYLVNYWFKVPFAMAVVIGVVAWIAMEAYARFKFFYKLPVAKNWKPFKKDNMFVSIAKNYTHLRLMVVDVFLVALIFAMISLAKTGGYEGINYYAMIALSIGCGAFAFVILISLIVKFARKL